MKTLKNIDKPLFFISVALFALGLIMVFSASNVEAYMSKQVSAYYYFIRQGIFLFAGLILFFVMIKFPTKSYGILSRPLLFLGIMALIGVLIIGSEKNHAQSWFDIGPFSIQPSEFIKVITIAWIAYWYEKKEKKLDKYIPSLLPIGICVIIAGLIFAQPDFGTTIIYAVIVGLIFLAVPVSNKIKIKTVVIAIGAIAFAGGVLLTTGKSLLQERQLERLREYRNPCSRLLDSGNQVCNCYIAINNGGLFGVGLGNSKQKYLYLPEPYTDFIFAILVEELGLVTGVALIISYMIILKRIIAIGMASKTNRGSTICYGVALYIFIHIAVNLMGIMGLIPITGVPLPFISYGGSYTICLIAALAMVQRVNIENKLAKESD